jgi:hypothetical protein
MDQVIFLQWLQHDPRRLLWSGTRNISWELFLILHLDSFNILKHALTSSPILIYPCLEKEFILDTDASGTGTGAVLSQIGDDGREHVEWARFLSHQALMDQVIFLQWLQHDPRRLLWSGTRNISWELFLILHLSYDQISM